MNTEYEQRHQARMEWLLTLKVGDTACYKDNWNGYVTLEIVKITPTRQIKTNRGYTFKDGYCRLDSWSGMYLEEVTQQVLDQIEKRNLVQKAKKISFELLELNELKLICAIAGKEKTS